MHESDRPLAERVSVLDRGSDSADLTGVESPALKRGLSELQCVRLVLTVNDCRVFVGCNGDDDLWLHLSNRNGGGGCGSFRRVLREHGAIVMINSSGARVLVVGIVADNVSDVRVGDVRATLGSNGFLAEIGPDDSPAVVITTPEGDREVGPPTQP